MSIFYVIKTKPFLQMTRRRRYTEKDSLCVLSVAFFIEEELIVYMG